MINAKMTGMLLAAFVAGAFVASPELRAYAANTVFSADIKDGEVKTQDIAIGAVTKAKLGSDVLDTLTVVQRRGTPTLIPSGGVRILTALCQSGEVATGGGFDGNFHTLIVFQSMASFNNNGWQVSVHNPSTDGHALVPFVVCAKLSP